MINVITGSLLFFIVGSVFFSALFIVYSMVENEKKAAIRMILVTVFLLILGAALIFVGAPFVFQITLLVFILVALSVVLFRFGNKSITFPVPKKQFDERDVMFSRAALKPDTKNFKDYYAMRPQNLQVDNAFRKLPGLLNANTKYYNRYIFSAANATFSAVNLLQSLTEQKTQESNDKSINADEATLFLKKWVEKLGVHSVGFTHLQSHHLYSHIGRGKKYGDAVELNHKFAIAFTVEMSHESLSYAPQGPVVMESSQQYLNAGTIAVQIAEFIRNLGFEARAHIDANYRVICPLVAQDAGLGTIGRMGLLMTPKLGARVRVAVVTTNMELVTTSPKEIDSSVVRFCEICKKCAVNCPSNAISFNSGKTKLGWQLWKISHEKCYTYWCKIGTDCGRCITVCPYSHPNNFIHNTIRWMIKRNPVNRWLALKLDNYFYGTKPALILLKKWMG